MSLDFDHVLSCVAARSFENEEQCFINIRCCAAVGRQGARNMAMDERSTPSPGWRRRPAAAEDPVRNLETPGPRYANYAYPRLARCRGYRRNSVFQCVHDDVSASSHETAMIPSDHTGICGSPQHPVSKFSADNIPARPQQSAFCAIQDLDGQFVWPNRSEYGTVWQSKSCVTPERRRCHIAMFPFGSTKEVGNGHRGVCAVRCGH